MEEKKGRVKKGRREERKKEGEGKRRRALKVSFPRGNLGNSYTNTLAM